MSKLISLATVALALGTLAACGGGSSSPTDPGTPALMSLTGAAVVVDGQTVPSGSTYHQDAHGDGHHTRFEARLMVGGAPALGQIAQVRYEMPMGMMRGPGAFQLYDDGTHGDLQAGDGVYCYEDDDGDFGFHHMDAMHGNYDYDFYGVHHDGSESNHMMYTVDVEN
jgi:hypothetical protein